ncbi:hypothetical protein Pan216_42370 [Planctomycetes bacterium Pan216]|uniref:SHSP domain-containing protein n=1 Tax=Kolteria novifilia TaxID=2527975 RepID=A0A518B8Q4_9BACT|nr:hypothetical protein Pan216_42370 [Planctomycetes bacterium Pan216]
MNILERLGQWFRLDGNRRRTGARSQQDGFSETHTSPPIQFTKTGTMVIAKVEVGDATPSDVRVDVSEEHLRIRVSHRFNHRVMLPVIVNPERCDMQLRDQHLTIYLSRPEPKAKNDLLDMAESQIAFYS